MNNETYRENERLAAIAAQHLLDNPPILKDILIMMLIELCFAETIGFDWRGHAYDSHCGEFLDPSITSEEEPDEE